MKRIILLILAVLVIPTVALAQKPKKGAKEVSPIIEGKQKVRKVDYDSVWEIHHFRCQEDIFL